jgi:hypothetical protein
MYRLVVQPNAARAQMFAEVFITSGGIETLLVLLQREAKTGEDNVLAMGRSGKRSSTDPSEKSPYNESGSVKQLDSNPHDNEIGFDLPGPDGNSVEDDNVGSLNVPESVRQEKEHGSTPVVCDSDSVSISNSINTERLSAEIGGISLSISADSARNNVYNVDNSDAVVVGIIRLIGALISSGHLTFDFDARSDVTSNILGSGLHENGGTMFDDKVALLLFALLKAFQAAPNRLMTDNVYTTLLGASVWHVLDIPFCLIFLTNNPIEKYIGFLSDFHGCTYYDLGRKKWEHIAFLIYRKCWGVFAWFFRFKPSTWFLKFYKGV